MIELVATLLLKALVVLGVARLLPGVRIQGFGAAVAVAAVYGLLTMLLKGALVLFSLPLVVLSLGLFMLVINGFLLWLTDRLIGSFEIRGFGSLALATLAITAGDVLVHGFVDSLL
jgi:putative membrane protein